MRELLSRWFHNPRGDPGRSEAGLLRVQAGDALLEPHREVLSEIRRLAGLPDAHWQSLYRKTLLAYAALVQQLPASEAHHHAFHGGLLAHGLETALSVLRLRRGKLLPPNTGAEEMARLKDLWSFTLFTAALLHDLGRPLTDMEVLRHANNGTEQGPWIPWSGPMTDGWYSFRFRRQRNYTLHQRAGAFLAGLVVPAEGLGWIASELPVFDPWTAALAGDMDNAGILGELVQQADQRSVARSLGGEQAAGLPQARRRPLHERMLDALRYLIDEGRLPFNRDGAAGWRVGDDVWLVSKRVLDEIRAHLIQEGQTGLPSRNDRLMDELQQWGVIEPAPDGKAIWRCRVFAEGWRKAHELTLLRMPVTRLWPGADSRPEPMEGAGIEVLEDSAGDGPMVQEALPDSDEKRETVRSEDGGSTSPPPVVALDSDVQPGAQSDDGREHLSPSVQPPTGDLSQEASESTPDAGQAFLDWLRAGLAGKTLSVNQVDARVHRVAEGLLLVSPGLFKDFQVATGVSWEQAQKRFQRLKLHRKTPQGTNIHTYTVAGKRRTGRIKGFLIPDIDEVFPGLALPPPNRYLGIERTRNAPPG